MGCCASATISADSEETSGHGRHNDRRAPSKNSSAPHDKDLRRQQQGPCKCDLSITSQVKSFSKSIFSYLTN
jgi:hypothetical protein